MPGLVPGIHDAALPQRKNVDGRDEPGHDGTVSTAGREFHPWRIGPTGR
jgi:hypothetical protein